MKRSNTTSGGLLVLALLAGAALCGCQRTILKSNEPRTQFETYDQLRQQSTPLEEPDAYGTPQPALRARLSPPA